jgi:hypothetical protein
VLWHKERLINLAVELLPVEYDAVAWIDGDVLFQDADWLPKSRELLGEVPLMQPWSRLQWLDADYRAAERWRPDSGQARSLAACLGKHGHSGHAWIARREWIEQVGGLLDTCIIGGADAMMTHGFLGNLGRLPTWARDWGRRAYAATGGRIGCLPGKIDHLWHGSWADRDYQSRLRILRRGGYDPPRHLDGRRGLYEFTKEAPQGMIDGIEQYFQRRREDGADHGHDPGQALEAALRAEPGQPG